MLNEIFIILLFYQKTNSISLSVPTKCNSSTSFACRDSIDLCIPLEWKCDNIDDCGNGADEIGCFYLSACDVGMMMCPDGTCISQEFKCDGEADCPTSTDENGCVEYHESREEKFYFALKVECKTPNFVCNSSSSCLPPNHRCNRIKDCPDGEDEDNCSLTNETFTDTSMVKLCVYGYYKCATSDACVPSYWICDGSPDCEDESDEANCQPEKTDRIMSPSTLCKVDQYSCAGENPICVNVNATCDFTPDCPFGDDENSEKCRNCQNKCCSYRCQITPSGEQCYCPEGEYLDANLTTCHKLRNCENKGKQCQHFCVENGSSYTCTCAKFYALGKDGHTCHAEDQNGAILSATHGAKQNSEIFKLPMYGEAVYGKVYELDLVDSVSHLDYAYRTDTLYFAANRKFEEIGRYSNGKRAVLRQNLIGISSLAVDFVTENIYFTQNFPSKQPGIHVCTKEMFYCRRIAQSARSNKTNRQLFRELTLDVNKGKMFWIGVFTDRKARIMTASMDGSGIKILIDNKLLDPKGLALDPIRNELYYNDVKLIAKINLKTLERHIVLTNESPLVFNPYEMKFFDGSLYFNDRPKAVKSFNVITKKVQALHWFDSFTYGLTLNHSAYQIIPPINPCKTIKKSCLWICVLVARNDGQLSSSCLCPDYYQLSPEKDTCFIEKEIPSERESFIGIDYLKELCQKNNSFCLNDGKCVKKEGYYIGCKCAHGFVGERCEVKAQETNLSKDYSYYSDHTGTIFGFLLLSFFVLAFGFLIFYPCLKKRLSQFNPVESTEELFEESVSYTNHGRAEIG